MDESFGRPHFDPLYPPTHKILKIDIMLEQKYEREIKDTNEKVCVVGYVVRVQC